MPTPPCRPTVVVRANAATTERMGIFGSALNLRPVARIHMGRSDFAAA